MAAGTLRELAQVLESRLGHLGEALLALEKAARLAPDASVLSELAELNLRSERPSHARRALEDVLALLPKNAPPERLAEIRSRLGRACELLGDRDAAITHYRQALAVRRLDKDIAQRLDLNKCKPMSSGVTWPCARIPSRASLTLKPVSPASDEAIHAMRLSGFGNAVSRIL